MFIHSLILLSISVGFPCAQSLCYSKSSQTWICNNRSKIDDYQTILANEKFETFFLKNYQLSVFIIDQYPSSLRLFNASHNQFESIVITSKNRDQSNLRQLILRSNHIRDFQMKNVVLPKSLQIISLANNQLEVLDARIFLPLKNLTKLDLRNNLLKRILPQLLWNRNIRLTNNPLECQCTPDFYRILCLNSTNLKQPIEGNRCLAPYHESQLYDAPSLSYLRFSTFTLICPIHGYPPPIIVWSTPFGNLTSINSSDIDLLSSNSTEPIYITLTARAGPFTARTKHRLHAFNSTHLSVTRARAALQHRLSCSGISMLGVYTYRFDFDIDIFVQKRALWYIIYTAGFGFFMSLVAGALCVTVKRTSYYSGDDMKTPPVYPTLTPNSAARTPPNFEVNQWLSLAAANISGTLEQVRDKLRVGVQHVSESVGRASELITHSVQHAGGTIRQAAETSAAYLQSFRETSQQRLNTMRVHTLSSLRNSGQFMRAGMNMLTTQVNSLRDYCGVTTTQPLSSDYMTQQQQLHQMQNSPIAMTYLRYPQISTIVEDEENIVESMSLLNPRDPSPYVGNIPSNAVVNASGIGQLNTADNSALSTINSEPIASGQLSSGIGIFHGQNEELVIEPTKLNIYGTQRPQS